MIEVHPDVDDGRPLRLFGKGIHGQWAEDAVARTPVRLGEERAMRGIGSVPPMMRIQEKTEGALSRASTALDEARHRRRVHRPYDRTGEEPAAPRRERRAALLVMHDGRSSHLAPASRGRGLDPEAIFDSLWLDSERWVDRLALSDPAAKAPARPKA